MLKKILTVLLIFTLLGVMSLAAFMYSGIYNIAGDEPHWTLTTTLIETVRERSIERHAQDVKVPELSEPGLIQEGATHYSAMCVGCHLAPGKEDTEIRVGLYPRPPNLSESARAGMSGDAAKQFWVIKHGIKLTAMPAWGRTHDDRAIWALVSFLQELPAMSPGEYASLTELNSREHHHSH